MKAVGFLWNATAIPDSFCTKPGHDGLQAVLLPALKEAAHLAMFMIPKKGTHTVLVLPFMGFYSIIDDKMNKKPKAVWKGS